MIARPYYTVEAVVEALRDEAIRLGRLYQGSLGEGYLLWRRRLDDLLDDQRPERDLAHRALLKIYEDAGEGLI